jgi:hypothetical protein
VGEPDVASEDCIDLTGARLRSDGTSWICGRAGTLCAGRPPFESWSKAPFPESDVRPRLTSIYSLDDRFWVTRADGKIMRWQDGAWEISTVSYGEYLQDVAFLTDRDGVAIGYTSIFQTTNGGGTWDQHQLAPDLFLFEFDCLRCVGVFSRHSLDDAPLFSYRVGAQHPGASGLIEPCLLRPVPMLRLSPALLRGLKLQRFIPARPE